VENALSKLTPGLGTNLLPAYLMYEKMQGRNIRCLCISGAISLIALVGLLFGMPPKITFGREEGVGIHLVKRSLPLAIALCRGISHQFCGEDATTPQSPTADLLARECPAGAAV
jgi:hypothetical protein